MSRWLERCRYRKTEITSWSLYQEISCTLEFRVRCQKSFPIHQKIHAKKAKKGVQSRIGHEWSRKTISLAPRRNKAGKPVSTEILDHGDSYEYRPGRALITIDRVRRSD